MPLYGLGSSHNRAEKQCYMEASALAEIQLSKFRPILIEKIGVKTAPALKGSGIRTKIRLKTVLNLNPTNQSNTNTKGDITNEVL